MTERQKATQREQLAAHHGTDPEDHRGENFGDALQEAERCGAVVFWGCWTDTDLREVL